MNSFLLPFVVLLLLLDRVCSRLSSPCRKCSSSASSDYSSAPSLSASLSGQELIAKHYPLSNVNILRGEPPPDSTVVCYQCRSLFAEVSKTLKYGGLFSSEHRFQLPNNFDRRAGFFAQFDYSKLLQALNHLCSEPGRDLFDRECAHLLENVGPMLELIRNDGRIVPKRVCALADLCPLEVQKTKTLQPVEVVQQVFRAPLPPPPVEVSFDSPAPIPPSFLPPTTLPLAIYNYGQNGRFPAPPMISEE